MTPLDSNHCARRSEKILTEFVFRDVKVTVLTMTRTVSYLDADSNKVLIFMILPSNSIRFPRKRTIFILGVKS